MSPQKLNSLFLLSVSSRKDDELIPFFLENGASRSATIGIDIYPDYDDDEELDDAPSPLWMVVQNALVLAIYENPYPIHMVKILLKEHVDPNFVDEEGNAVILHALDDVELVSMLVESGASLDWSDPLGKTPLMLACEGENSEVALYLIEHDVHINRLSGEMKSALHYALMCHLMNNYEVVSSLISHGADVEMVDGEGRTPLEIAKIHYAHRQVITLLEKVLKEKRAIS
jgi:ankyrin repeat protein